MRLTRKQLKRKGSRRRGATRRGGGRFGNFLRGCVGGICRRGTQVAPVNENAIGSPPAGPVIRAPPKLNSPGGLEALQAWIAEQQRQTAAAQAAAMAEFRSRAADVNRVSNALSRPLPGGPSNAEVEAELAGLLGQPTLPGSVPNNGPPASAGRSVGTRRRPIDPARRAAIQDRVASLSPEQRNSLKAKVNTAMSAVEHARKVQQEFLKRQAERKAQLQARRAAMQRPRG